MAVVVEAFGVGRQLLEGRRLEPSDEKGVQPEEA